jgi:hypothetical protein
MVKNTQLHLFILQLALVIAFFQETKTFCAQVFVSYETILSLVI